MIQSISSWKFRLLAVVVTCAAFACLAIASTTTHATTDDGHAESVARVALPPSAPPAVANERFEAFREHFALLRSTDVLALPESSVIVDTGLDRAHAREIAPVSSARLAAAGAAAPQERLWVAPRDDGTQCLLAQSREAEGPAQVCATPDQAVAGYFLMTTGWTPERVAIYGVVPDGVDSVTISFRDGTSTVLPTKLNVYAAEFDKPTASVTFVDAEGEQHELNAGVDV